MPNQKFRHRDAELAERHHAEIAGAVVARRGVETGGERQHHGQRHRQQRQRQRDREALGHQLDDGAVVSVARAEVQRDQAAASRDSARARAVEPEPGFERGHRLGRGALAQHHLRDVAGQQIEHREHHHRGHGQRDQQARKRLSRKRAMAVPRRKSSAYDGRKRGRPHPGTPLCGRAEHATRDRVLHFISTYSHLSVTRAEARAARDGWR